MREASAATREKRTDLGDGWFHVVTRFTLEVEGGTKPVCVADSVGRALVS
jgi:hypothetical protein